MSNLGPVDIPIVSEGQLIPEAGMLVLGYMIYPNCERSAHQFARILAEETIAKARDEDYQPGQIYTGLVKSKSISLLLLAGQVAARVCANFVRTGNAEFRKAAHVVSEMNANVKTLEGKPLPTTESRLRATYLKNQASMHLWAAASIGFQTDRVGTISGIDILTEIQVCYETLGPFLHVAKQFEERLAEAKPYGPIWSASNPASEIWDFNAFPEAYLGEQPEAMTIALSSYHSPQKS